jgi:hypothetical protein
MQSSMPIFSGTGMEICEGSYKYFKVRAFSFSSVVRLYRLNPKFEFLGEWPIVESTLIESSELSAQWKVQTIYIGGGINFALKHGCLKDYSIKGGHELIEKLAQLDRQEVVRDRGFYYFGDPCPLVFSVDLSGAGFWGQAASPTPS